MGKKPSREKEKALKDDAQLKERVREIVEEILVNRLNLHADLPDGEALPPEPITVKGKGKGRRENRKYDRITLTLDHELARRFTREAKSRGLSAGRLLDAILWNRYGRPKLTYGDDKSEE